MKKLLVSLLALMLCCACACAENVTALPEFAAYSGDCFTCNEMNDYSDYTEFVYSGMVGDFDIVEDYVAGLTDVLGYEVVATEKNVETLADEVCYLTCPDESVGVVRREIDAWDAQLQIHVFYYPGADDMDVVFRMGEGLSFAE